jgi:hypothetical protein
MKLLSSAKNYSIGFKSGEYGDKYTMVQINDIAFPYWLSIQSLFFNLFAPVFEARIILLASRATFTGLL